MYSMGEKLRYLRESRKLSQSQIAKKLNLSTSAVSSYENDTKTPSVEVLTQLALLYNVKTDYLLGIDNHEYLSIDGLSESQKEIVNSIIHEFKKP